MALLDPKHETAIKTYADELGVDPDLARAVAEQESGSLGAKAVSPKGARGVMQVMPSTSKELAPKFGPDTRRQGVGYLSTLRGNYKDLPDPDSYTLAAYNAGPGNVAKARAKAKAAGLDDTKFENIANYLPEETRNYVPGVLKRRGGTNIMKTEGVAQVEHLDDDPDSPENLLKSAGASPDDQDSPEALLASATEAPKTRSFGEQAREYVPGLQGVTDLAKLAGHYSGVRPLSDEEWNEMAARGREQQAHPIRTGLGAISDIAGVAVPGFRGLTAAGSALGPAVETATGSQTLGRVAAAAPAVAQLGSQAVKGGAKLVKGAKGLLGGESVGEIVTKGLGAGTTAQQAGRVLQEPGKGGRAAITQSTGEASRLYGEAGGAAKAAGSAVPTRDRSILLATRKIAKDVEAAGGSLSGDARRVIRNIRMLGSGKKPPASKIVTPGVTAAPAKAPAVAMPVDQLIEQQSRLRQVINTLGPKDPQRGPLIKLSQTIDDAMAAASKGTGVGEKLGQARGYYRDVTIPTQKTMGRVVRAEEPESATRFLTQPNKPSRFQRLEAQQLGPKGEEFAGAVENVRSASFNEMIQKSTKDGKVDLRNLADHLQKAESGGQLGAIANTPARTNTIRAIRKVAKIQRIAAKAPIAGGGAGLSIGWLGMGAGYTIGRVINASLGNERASRALLRLASAKVGSPGWTMARDVLKRTLKIGAPVAQEIVSRSANSKES